MRKAACKRATATRCYVKRTLASLDRMEVAEPKPRAARNTQGETLEYHNLSNRGNHIPLPRVRGSGGAVPQPANEL